MSKRPKRGLLCGWKWHGVGGHPVSVNLKHFGQKMNTCLYWTFEQKNKALWTGQERKGNKEMILLGKDQVNRTIINNFSATKIKLKYNKLQILDYKFKL